MHLETQARIVALAKSGIPPSKISERLISEGSGTYSANYVSVIISQARGRGEQIGSFCSQQKSGTPRYVVMPESWRALAPEAKRRGMTISALARTILETVIRDNLFDAVLDVEDGS